MKAPVTRSEEGGVVYVRVKAHDRVKEGGMFIAVALWCGRGAAQRPWCGGARGGSGAAGALREEGEGGEGMGLVGWLGLPGRSGPKGWVHWLGLPGYSGPKGWVGWLATGPIGPKVEEDFFSDKKLNF
jgi:hypothetical protein